MSEFLQIRTMRYTDDHVEKACFVWCPGCARHHVFWIEGRSTVWEWDGDEEKPTFSPSHLTWGGNPDIRCHSFLREGRWEFLGDSTHSLAGQTIDMVPLPLWLQKEGQK